MNYIKYWKESHVEYISDKEITHKYKSYLDGCVTGNW